MILLTHRRRSALRSAGKAAACIWLCHGVHRCVKRHRKHLPFLRAT